MMRCNQSRRVGHPGQAHLVDETTRRKCATCQASLGGYEAQPVFLNFEAMGDERTESVWHCSLCDHYTRQTSVDSFLGEDSVSVSALTPQKGASHTAFLRKCPEPIDKRCDCEVHLALAS